MARVGPSERAGIDAELIAAQKALRENNYRIAIEAVAHALYVEPNNKIALNIMIACLDKVIKHRGHDRADSESLHLLQLTQPVSGNTLLAQFYLQQQLHLCSTYTDYLIDPEAQLTTAQRVAILQASSDTGINLLTHLITLDHIDATTHYMQMILSAAESTLSTQSKLQLLAIPHQEVTNESLRCYADIIDFSVCFNETQKHTLKTSAIRLTERHCRAAIKMIKHSKGVRVRELMLLQNNYHDWRVDEASSTAPDPTAVCSDTCFLRLKKHLASLIKITCKHHADNASNPLFVTRLSTPEFSFYTDHPLSHLQFIDIMGSIRQDAKLSPVNIHLLLSSFAVMIDKELCNITLYVSSGPEANLYQILKNRPSHADPSYARHVHLFQEPVDAHALGYIMSGSESPLILNNHIIQVPVHNQMLQVSVSICLDHAYHHAANVLWRHFSAPHSGTIYSPGIDQVLASNYIAAESGYKVSSSFIHVDPFASHYSPSFRFDKALDCIEDSDFGKGYRIYDQMTHNMGALTSALEYTRRQANIHTIAHSLGVSIDFESIVFHIEKTLHAGNTEKAISLLQLISRPLPDTLLQRLFHCCHCLPAAELNRGIACGFDLPLEILDSLIERADVLDQENINRLLTVDALIELSPDSINLLAQHSYKLDDNNKSQLLARRADCIRCEGANGIIACNPRLTSDAQSGFSALVDRFMPELSPIAYYGLCQRLDQLSTPQIDQLTRYIDNMTSESISLLVNFDGVLSDDASKRLEIYKPTATATQRRFGL
ncbi:MAG: hypothetical protein P1U63_06465 [Coxiellaceae bacterium]|nr:hypothetical protein [Coxiellaceae bacterium]